MCCYLIMLLHEGIEQSIFFSSVTLYQDLAVVVPQNGETESSMTDRKLIQAKEATGFPPNPNGRETGAKTIQDLNVVPEVLLPFSYLLYFYVLNRAHLPYYRASAYCL